MGIIDGMTKGDLVHFLSDVSRINRKYFGDITMHKNYSFFDADSSKDAKLAESFLGIEIEGRQIRVNIDEQKKSRKAKPRGNAARGKSGKGGKKVHRKGRSPKRRG